LGVWEQAVEGLVVWDDWTGESIVLGWKGRRETGGAGVFLVSFFFGEVLGWTADVVSNV